MNSNAPAKISYFLVVLATDGAGERKYSLPCAEPGQAWKGARSKLAAEASKIVEEAVALIDVALAKVPSGNFWEVPTPIGKFLLKEMEMDIKRSEVRATK